MGLARQHSFGLIHAGAELTMPRLIPLAKGSSNDPFASGDRRRDTRKTGIW
jgi:hypothetical protein